MSGAYGALGGDLSVVNNNPAGLAIYRGSEFTITPALNFSNTNSEFDNGKFNERNTVFLLNNIGYVFTRNLFKEKGFQSLNFGLAYNRLSDFNSKAYIWSPAAGSSMLDGFVWNANNYGAPLHYNQLNDFYEGLAYDTYGIDILPDGTYTNIFIEAGNDYGQAMKRTMSTKGGINEFSLSMGANMNHTLFFGATFGIQSVSYKESYFHIEEPDFAGLKYFDFSQDFSLDGTGVNFKAGVIYRPIHMLRLGAAIHTPTRFWLRPYLLTGMETQFGIAPPDQPDGKTDRQFFYETESDRFQQRFNIVTPWRYQFSAATVISSLGVANIDVEYVNYTTCKILPNSDYGAETGIAETQFKGNLNIRFGAEFRLGPMFFRGGTAYYGSPYKKEFLPDFDNSHHGTLSYSGGIGFRARNFYMDAAFSHMNMPQRRAVLYETFDDIGRLPISTLMKTSSGKFTLTFGFRL